MQKGARSALFRDAGRLHVMREELASLKSERDKLDQRVRVLERRIAEADAALTAMLERITKRGARALAADEDDFPITRGKLPHRVLSHMRRDPARLYTAAELSADLSIKDVQQVRTALARLVNKGLVRRSGVKGQFVV
jgi:hypothetical protein